MSLATTDLASRGPERERAQHSINCSLRDQLSRVGLQEDRDWLHLNEDDQGQISIVLLRDVHVLTEPVLLAAARALDGLDWELFLAIDGGESNDPTPVVMVSRYALSPMPKTPPTLAETMSKASKQLFAEYPSEPGAE